MKLKNISTIRELKTKTFEDLESSHIGVSGLVITIIFLLAFFGKWLSVSCLLIGLIFGYDISEIIKGKDKLIDEYEDILKND